MDWKLIVALFCLLAAFQVPNSTNLVPSTNPTVPQPEARLVEVVSPLKSVELDAETKQNASDLFTAMADIILVDDSVKTNAQLREAVMVAGKFMFEGKIGKQSPDLIAKLNAIMLKELGDTPQEFDKGKAVALFHALAWVFNV